MRLVPQIPGIGGGSGRDVKAFGRLVEPDLIFPLAVVHFRRGASAAVHGYPQGTFPFRRTAKGFFKVAQRFVSDLDGLRFDFGSALRSDAFAAIGPKQIDGCLRFGLGKIVFVPIGQKSGESSLSIAVTFFRRRICESAKKSTALKEERISRQG